MRRVCLILFVLCLAVEGQAQTWHSLGPPGGDVRVLAVDPSHRGRIFLGTADGHIFGSEDSGGKWELLGRASSRPDAVITSIVVDPRDGKRLFASSWTRDSSEGGGISQSFDGGRSWRGAGLAGKAVRALVIAPSNSDLLAAGTLDGIYISRDDSKTWERISPERNRELRNLDSLAFDPRDPQTIYAGTFHLPWKTTDGGHSWEPVHEGMIDDSDVMSMLVDGNDARRVYASACSGIYRSDDAAAQWRKIQGIPYAARRTYAIAQDPEQSDRVYAATSEGLWMTSDGGITWRRATPESWVVNSVVVSQGQPRRILIGTEELGVLTSDDDGDHFQDANNGFDHRQILALGLDPQNPSHVLVVLAHSPDPILASEDDGRTWSPLGQGLRAERALRVYAAPDGGWWVSLAAGGLARYDAPGKTWKRQGRVTDAGGEKSRQQTRKGQDVGRKTSYPARSLQDVVSDMAFSSNEWYAGTNAGLLVSADRGVTWKKNPVGGLNSLSVQSVRVSRDGRKIRVVSLGGLAFSDDHGANWSWHDLPENSGGALRLYADRSNDNTLIAIARGGLYISRDWGDTWRHSGAGLPAIPINEIAASGGILIATLQAGGLYISSDEGQSWEYVPGELADGLFTGLIPANRTGSFFAASATEGLFLVEWSTPNGHAAFHGKSGTQAESRGTSLWYRFEFLKGITSTFVPF